VTNQPENVEIIKLPIRLGQFLKLANVVQDGFEATRRIKNGEVMVNSTVVTNRGKKLQELDEITVDRKTWRITALQ
jgi:ribosome-associated protein